MIRIALVLAVAVLATAGTALAQRDAGSKMRGNHTNFYQGRAAAPSFATPAPAAGYQAFSYVPAPFVGGDEVVVRTSTAPVMRGANALASAARGERLEVISVRGQWVGVAVERDGQRISGWIAANHLAPAGG